MCGSQGTLHHPAAGSSDDLPNTPDHILMRSEAGNRRDMGLGELSILSPLRFILNEWSKQGSWGLPDGWDGHSMFVTQTERGQIPIRTGTVTEMDRGDFVTLGLGYDFLKWFV